MPLDFDTPLDEVWPGFLMPERLREDSCPGCKNGYSPHAQYLFDLWYGHVPFAPKSPLRLDHPAVRAFAERNVTRSPEYYGVGESAIRREAARLASLWNSMWCHHLCQEDVDALVADGRLKDFTHTWSREKHWQKIEPPVVPTAEQVNEWSLHGVGHDSINASVVVRARCKREDFPEECATCEGHGSVEAYPGQRAEAEAWEPTEPPTGDGWQLWSTTTEGSPMSPVFASGEELAVWMSTNPSGFAGAVPSLESARAFVEAGWAPSMISVGGDAPVDGVSASQGEAS